MGHWMTLLRHVAKFRRANVMASQRGPLREISPHYIMQGLFP